MIGLARRCLRFFVDSRFLAAGAILCPALCAALRAAGLPAQEAAVLLVAGLAGTLAVDVRRAITRR